MKNINKKKLKNIIIVFAVLLVVMMMVVEILSMVNNHKERTGPYVRPEMINPMFAENFFKKYTGENSKEDILNSLTDFVYYIVDNKQEINNLNKQEVSKQYNENENKFKAMGFSTEEDFLKIMTAIQNINTNELEYSYIAFEMNTMEISNNTTNIRISLKFSNIPEIRFNLEVENTYKTDGIIHIKY